MVNLTLFMHMMGETETLRRNMRKIIQTAAREGNIVILAIGHCTDNENKVLLFLSLVF